MSLKPKKSQISVEPSASRSDNLSGPWGRINRSAESSDVVRFCQGTTIVTEKTHSYPYRVISSWHWSRDAAEEELKIEASGDLVTVKGRGLDRVVDALDSGALELLCEVPEDSQLPEHPIWVASVTVEATR